jgi:hypothetical protein
MRKERLRKLRVHLLIGSLYFVAFTISITMKLFAGEVFSTALWHSITDVRPVEWMMLVIVWWTAASSLNSDAWNTKGLGLLISELKRKGAHSR